MGRARGADRQPERDVHHTRGTRPSGARTGKPGAPDRRAHQPPRPRHRNRPGRRTSRGGRGDRARRRRHGERGGQRRARRASERTREPRVTPGPRGSPGRRRGARRLGQRVRPLARHQPRSGGGHQPARGSARCTPPRWQLAADRFDGLWRAMGAVHRGTRCRRRGGGGRRCAAGEGTKGHGHSLHRHRHSADAAPARGASRR